MQAEQDGQDSRDGRATTRHKGRGRPCAASFGLLPICLLCAWMATATAQEAAKEAAKTEEAEETTLKRSERKQVEIGRKSHQQIIAKHGLYRDPEIQAYIQRIGERLAAVSNNTNFPYTFTVLDDPEVNAFALPGGFIYITRGMLAHLNSESQLAAVLGHEIAHVTERHAQRAKNRGTALNVLGAVGTVATGMPVHEVAGLTTDLYLRGYSRGFELDADALGAEYMARAGYHPKAMLGTIEMLKANDRLELERARLEKREPRIYHGILSTHPDHDKRYREAIEAAFLLGGRVRETLSQDQFLEKLNGLAYGPSRQVGVLRRDVFYYPRFGFRLSIPDNWRQVRGRIGAQFMSPSADAALVISAAPLRQGKTPEQQLRDRGFVLREGSAITIAGNPAWIGIAEQAASPFGPRPLRIALITAPQRHLTFLLEGSGKHDLRKLAADRDFVAAIFSFDRMTRRDFELAHTPKLQVVRAEPGTTYAGLAAASALPNYQEATLRLLNGDYPAGEPRPGELVKLVQ